MADQILLGKTVHTPSPADFRYLRERVPEATHPQSLELLALWQECERRDGMRMGRDVPSRALARLLPNIAVTEPVEGWSDGYIRLAGFVYSERFGRDITGLTIREVYAGDCAGAEAIIAAGRDCTENHRFTVLHTRVLRGTFELMRFEVLALPVLNSDASASWALTGTFRL